MKNYRITGGLIIDGSGAPPRPGDVFISNGVIMPDDWRAEAAELDARGMVVAPGFIDMHRHADLAALSGGLGAVELSQGITTTVVGNCGLAPVPNAPKSRRELFDYIEPCLGRADGFEISGFGEYMRALDKADLPINIGALLATGTATAAIKGFSDAPFTQKALAEACDLIDGAMDDGALGISTGLLYTPECYTERDALIAMAARAAAHGGPMMCHIRMEGAGLVESVQEIIEIARDAGIGLGISHFKSTGVDNWGRLMPRAIEHIERARAAGQDVTVDFYPYHYSATTLMSILPASVLAGDRAEALAALGTPSGVARVLSMAERGQPGWDNQARALGFERMIISSVVTEANKPLEGLSMRDIAERWGLDGWSAVCRLLFEEGGKVGVIQQSMHKDDVRRAARLPYSVVISDALYGDTDRPHPRLLGAFPRALRLFVSEERLMPIEQMIAKMTAMPAARMGIEKRGLIRPGYHGDLCVFDPAQLTDRADLSSPPQLSTGMRWVLVNGRLAWDGGVADRAAGRVIRRRGQ